MELENKTSPIIKKKPPKFKEKRIIQSPLVLLEIELKLIEGNLKQKLNVEILK